MMSHIAVFQMQLSHDDEDEEENDDDDDDNDGEDCKSSVFLTARCKIELCKSLDRSRPGK